MTSSDANSSGSTAPAASPSVEVPEVIQRHIDWLVREQEVATTDEQRALLFFESAVARERIRDEAGAARDYLASYNANPAFREPIESLASL